MTTVKIRPLDLPVRGVTGRAAPAAALSRPARAVATALFFGTLAVYLFTLSAHFAPDGVAFARLVDAGRLTEPGFFQAEHVLYPFIGWVWYEVWVFFGFTRGSLAPLQVLNAIFGAAGIAILFLTVRVALGARQHSLVPSVLAALVAGTTQAYWMHSTDAEDMIPSVAAVTLAFLLLLRVRAADCPSRRLLAGLGFTLGLAPLLHGTQVLFWPVAAAGLLLPRPDWRAVRWVAAWTLGTVAAVFLLVGVGFLGFRSPGDYLTWLTSAPRVGVWGRLEVANLVTGAKTAVYAVLHAGNALQMRELLAGSFTLFTIVAWLGIALILGAAVATAVVLVRYRRVLPNRAVAGLCVLWVALYTVFALYWAPEDIQFWITPIVPAVILLTYAYVVLQDRRDTPHDLLAGLALFAFAVLVTINAVAGLVPRSDITRNVAYQRAMCLGDGLGRQDLVISAGWDWAGTYIPYFTPLDYVSVLDIFVGPGQRDVARTRNLIAERIAAAHARGNSVWTVNFFDTSPSDRQFFQRATGLTPDDFSFWQGPIQAECAGVPIRGVPSS